MPEWFDRVVYSADIPGLEREIAQEVPILPPVHTEDLEVEDDPR